jgi:hypothetical protein
MHRVLITKLGGINALGISRHRWKDDKEILEEYSNSMGLDLYG